MFRSRSLAAGFTTFCCFSTIFFANFSFLFLVKTIGRWGGLTIKIICFYTNINHKTSFNEPVNWRNKDDNISLESANNVSMILAIFTMQVWRFLALLNCVCPRSTILFNPGDTSNTLLSLSLSFCLSFPPQPDLSHQSFTEGILHQFGQI